MLSIRNECFELDIHGQADRFWTYRVNQTGKSYSFTAPVFEIDGVAAEVSLTNITEKEAPRQLRNGTVEYRFAGRLESNNYLSLELVFRVARDNPIVKFCYVLRSEAVHALTKSAGRDNLTYLSFSLLDEPYAKEVRFSEFIEMVHSFCLTESRLDQRHFDHQLDVMGPMLVGADDGHQMLVAYEHGSQVPDAFIQFRLQPDRLVSLTAVKGNYVDGQPIDPAHEYRTVWLQTGAVQGSEDDLARTYRAFVLHYMSLNNESRKPYIFYNTWNFQERNRNWYNKKYLDDMNTERMLAEIDVAHRMGIDVFVIDTGWYEKTGDWRVSAARFPDGLKSIKAKLDEYGMKLGLWFNPTAAALSSRMLENNRNSIMTRNGKEPQPRPIWETEESLPLCLVSDYNDAFAEQLIRLVKEVGATYFKWDAVGQYGCNDPGHRHGSAANSEQERADSYAFQQVLYMARIVDQVCEACPEAIVDFDITEGHRSVGLSFLSAGKYFLINNGPYYHNYDVPIDMEKDNWNLFFHPGPARGWICRTPLSYDKWFPSILFLTHYLPDDPQENQLMSIGSLILGQNGIWGDLPKISEEGVRRFGNILEKYKQIRRDITDSFPVRSGQVGGCPEVHEKISASSGRGAVVMFSCSGGAFTYITENKVDGNFWCTEDVQVSIDAEGRARIIAHFNKPSAAIILFGV